MKSHRIIAEIGFKHKVEMAIAKEMIMTAATYCKADVVKFQKRCNKELLSPEEYNAPHPHPENSYGKTYGEHREFLEFSLDQHRQLNIPRRCGISLLPRRYARYIPTLSRYLRPAT